MEFLEKLIECFQSKIENEQWLLLLFWSFVNARFVTFTEQIIRKVRNPKGPLSLDRT